MHNCSWSKEPYDSNLKKKKNSCVVGKNWWWEIKVKQDYSMNVLANSLIRSVSLNLSHNVN